MNKIERVMDFNRKSGRVEFTPMAQERQGRLIDDFLARVFVDSSIKTPEQGGRKIIGYFPDWKEELYSAIVAGNTTYYDHRDAFILRSTTLEHVAARTRLGHEAFLRRLEELVVEDFPQGSDVYEEISDQVSSWKLARDSMFEAIKIKREAERIAKGEEVRFNKNFADQAQNPSQDLTLKEEKLTSEDLRVRQRESVIKDRYIKGFVRSHFDSQDLPNATDGAKRLMEVFPAWHLGAVDYADQTQDFEIYSILQTLNYGDIIACSDGEISSIRKYSKSFNSEDSKPVVYWSQIRDYAIVAQLQDAQKNPDELEF